MRGIALAVVCGAALLAGGVAAADTWTDPAGRLKFDAPRGWSTQVERSDTFSYVITGTANNECQFISQPSANTATAPVDAVNRTAADSAHFGEDVWRRLANSVTPIFPNNSATVLSRTVDTSGFWPIQRAEIQSPDRVVHAAIQLRPGFEIRAFCMTYDGADTTAVYDAVIRSLGHPNDAQWQAAAEAAAAAAAPAPAPAQ